MLKIYHKYLLSKGYEIIISAENETYKKDGKIYFLKEMNNDFDNILYLEDMEGEKMVLPEELLFDLEEAVLEMTAADKIGFNICGQRNLRNLTVYSEGKIRYAADLIENSISIIIGKERRKLHFLNLKDTISFVLDRQRNGDWAEKAIIQGAA